MANSFRFDIDANDKASAKLEEVNKRIQALKPRSDVLDATAKLAGMQKKVADASGLSKLVGGFNGLSRATLGVFQNVGRIVTPLSAITGAASVAGMLRLTETWANFGTQLGFAAQRIGISGERLQSLQGAARLAGISAEGLTGGVQALGQSMFDAIGGRAPEAMIMLGKLKVNFQDATHHARNAADVLPEVADAIKALPGPYEQAMAAQTLFGASAQEMLPFLRLGSAGIADLTAKAKRYGVLNPAGIAAANRLRESYASVALAAEGLGNSIAERLSPVLTPLLNQFAEWIATSPVVKAALGDLGEGVKQFAIWIKGIDWSDVGAQIKTFGAEVQQVVDFLGGWKSATEIIFGLWVGAKFLSVLANITAVASALGAGSGVIGSLGALGAAIALGAAASGVTTSTDDFVSPQYRRDGDGDWFIKNNLVNPIRRLFGLAPRERQSAALAPDIEQQVRQGAAVSGLDPERMVALFRAEGGGYDRTSKAGAFGPAQLMPDTAKSLGAASGINEKDYDWRKNVLAGERYFAQLLKQSGGDYDVAAAGYNAGPNNIGVQRFNKTGDMGLLPDATRRYIASINSMLPAQAAAVPAALGAPAAMGAPQQLATDTKAPSGQASITVRHVNPPRGSTISATTQGNIWTGAPTVATSMPGF